MTIRSPTSSVVMPLRGMVTDYTGAMLILRTGPTAEERLIPAAEVVSVVTDYQVAHTRGLTLYNAGQIRPAEEQLQLALEEEERPWVRRELLAALVKCALFEGDLRRASVRFVAIIESDPQSHFWGLIPLVWEREAVKVPTDAEAQVVHNLGSTVARLIAASWNLERNGRRNPEAETTLHGLATEADHRVQRLAQMQLWRVRLTTGTVTANELRRWESAAEELPTGLRCGAHVLIGRGAMQQQDVLKAAAEWLWIPLRHAEHRGLAAWCQIRSAEALHAAGDSAAARLLAYEGQQRFGDSPLRNRMDALLKSLETPGSVIDPAP